MQTFHQPLVFWAGKLIGQYHGSKWGRSERCEEHSEMSAPCCAPSLAGTHQCAHAQHTTQATQHNHSCRHQMYAHAHTTQHTTHTLLQARTSVHTLNTQHKQQNTQHTHTLAGTSSMHTHTQHTHTHTSLPYRTQLCHISTHKSTSLLCYTHKYTIVLRCKLHLLGSCFADLQTAHSEKKTCLVRSKFVQGNTEAFPLCWSELQ